jgi:uncharacterized repeat protein (TIGR01451 family)
MNLSTMGRLLAAVCLGAFAVTAAAQQQRNPIESRLDARKVVTVADGKESFVAADAARPGDVIEYTATYRNTGTAAVKNLEATLPIPADTEFIAGSAKPAGARASLDARAFADMPLVRKVAHEGRMVDEPVPAREYRALRWYPGELAADKSINFTARVRVLKERGATAPPEAKGGTR